MIRMAAMLQIQRYGFMSSWLQIGNNKLKKIISADSHVKKCRR